VQHCGAVGIGIGIGIGAALGSARAGNKGGVAGLVLLVTGSWGIVVMYLVRAVTKWVAVWYSCWILFCKLLIFSM